MGQKSLNQILDIEDMSAVSRRILVEIVLVQHHHKHCMLLGYYL
jgi:hypothetical protein